MAALETAESPTIQEAFLAAKAEHSGTPERALDDDGTPAPEPATTTDEPPAQAPASDSASPETGDLISDADLSALHAKHPNDPAALAKELKGVFTKKTQELAEQRKAVEDLAGYRDFIADLKRDPGAALTRAAEQLGVTLAPKSETTRATETATATASTLADSTVEEFRQALGPDLDFMADQLAPAIRSLAERVAQAAVGQVVEPLKASQQALLAKASQEQTDAVLKTFTAQHPDWKAHEAAMMTIAKTLPAAKDADPLDYMGTLYKLATYDLQMAAATKTAVERLKKGAATAESTAETLSGEKVTITRPANPTTREAFEAAKRGERWD